MFRLHPTLEKDSHPVAEDSELVVRLIDDARFPWVLIVPKVEGARELHELSPALFERTMALASSLGRQMADAFAADKINTAALGNVVSQLHIHVIARREDDAAWPAPIWGIGNMVPLDATEAGRRTKLLREMLDWA